MSSDPSIDPALLESMAEGPDPADVAKRYWWVPALEGALAMIAGVVLLVVPRESLLTIAIVLGAELAALGVLRIARPFLIHDGGEGRGRWVEVLTGLIGLTAGVIVIARPGGAVTGVALVFGIWMILAGAAGLIQVFIYPDRRLVTALRSVVEIVIGIVIVASPNIALGTLVVLLALYLLARGVADVAVSLALRSAGRQSAS